MPKLTIDLEMRLAQFQDSLNKVQRDVGGIGKRLESTFKGLGSTIAALGVGVGLGALVGTLRSVAEEADKIGKAAQKVGITTEALSALRHAADLSDVSFEALTTGLVRLSKNMSDAAQGTGDAKDAFAALKINVERAGGGLKGTDEILAELADKFAEMEDSTGKTALAVKIFGRAGADLIPLLNAGSSGLAEMRAEAERLGIIIDSKTAKAAEEFNDNMTRLKRTVDGLAVSTFTPLIKQLADFTSAAFDATRETHSLAAALGALAVAKGRQALGASVGEQLAQARRDLESTIAAQQGVFGSGFLSQPLLEARRTWLENYIATLKAVQRQEALALGGPGAMDPRDLRLQGRLAPAPALPREPIGQRALRAANVIDEAKRAADALASLEEARAKAAVAQEQKLAQIRLDLLDRFHADGLIGEEDYWNRRLEIQRAALQSSISATEREIALRQEAVAKAPKGTADYLTALKELEDAQRRRNDLEQDLGVISTKNYLDAEKAAKAYSDEVTQTYAEQLRFQGRVAEATAQEIELQQRAARTRALAQGDTAQVIRLDEIRKATIARSEFNEVEQRGQDILRDLAAEEERIQNSRRVGATTELESLARTSAARQKAVEELKAISAELGTIAVSSKIPELERQAEEFQLQMESLAATSDLLAEKFDAIGESALGQLFDDVISGSKSAKEAIEDFGKSVVSEINKLVAQELGRKLYGSLFEAVGGGGTSLGGLLGGLFTGKGIGSIFGGGTISSNLGAELIAQGVAGFQHGGIFRVGGFGGPDSQLVPMRLTPGERVQITPPGQTSSVANNITVNVNAGGTGSGGASAGQVGMEVGFAVQRALRRNG